MKKIFYFLVNYRFYRIIALFYCWFAIKKKYSSKDKNRKNRLLFLNDSKFRGDIDVIGKTKKFTIFTLSERWASILLASLYEGKLDILQYHLKGEEFDDFYAKIAKLIKKYLKINAVIIPNYRYGQDYPFVKSFKRNNVPVIIFYRECLLTFERMIDTVTKRHQLFKGYPHDLVLVHNNVTRKSFLDSGFTDSKKISAVGALRMDSFINKINKINSLPEKKQITLFFFDLNSSNFGKEKLSEMDLSFGKKYKYAGEIWKQRDDLFCDLHKSLIEIALENPEIDVIIKTKSRYLNENNITSKLLKDCFRSFNKDISEIKNYTITSDQNAQTLILESRVVIGMQSSTMLEAALANKNVILPLFYNYEKSPNYQDFHWGKHLDQFTITRDKAEFKKMILKILNSDTKIDNAISDKRKHLFKKYFSNLEPSATSQYIEKIQEIISSNYF